MEPLRPGLPTTPPAHPATPAEAKLAAVLAEASLAEASLPDLPAPAASAVEQAVANARTEAAGRQAALGPVFADLARVLDAPALPPALKAAIARVLAFQTPTDRPPTAETIRAAVAQSGLFLETNLAAGRPAPMDLKAALLVLQQALTPDATRPPARRTPATNTPPPTREGALAGQPPAAARLDPEAEPAELVHQLRGEVDQALARQTLSQLASRQDGGGPHWMFELPLATPQGPAVAPFVIEADESSSSAQDTTPVWRARFALDLPGLGPVHVNLRMAGEHTAATLWAEAPETLARLRERGPELADELGGDVAFRAGAPAGTAPPPGRLLDHRS